MDWPWIVAASSSTAKVFYLGIGNGAIELEGKGSGRREHGTVRKSLRQLVKRHKFLLASATAILFGLGKCGGAIFMAIRPLMVKRYVKSHQVRKLQIGAGLNILAGWLNTDKDPISPRVVFLNAAKRFPFSGATIDYVYSEHLIEHLTYMQGTSMLRECFRILKPGGSIRIATPDLERFIRLYTPKKSSLQERYIHFMVDRNHPELGIYEASVAINILFRDFGHQFLYDCDLLQSTLEKVGFVQIAAQNVGESDDEVFRGLESHGVQCGDEEMNRFETMVVEARKPL